MAGNSRKIIAVGALAAALSVFAVPVDMAPPVSPPVGRASCRTASCEVAGETITLSAPGLRSVFTVADGRLSLLSLFNEYTDGEMLMEPGRSALFAVECRERRWYGDRDFIVQQWETGKDGFTAVLVNDAIGLTVHFVATVDTEGLRLQAEFVNSGKKNLDFKVAFPSISGLRLSAEAVDDYYYFPWGGGVIDRRPAQMRLGYGASQALWQVIDIFSPENGGGVYLRVDDDQGFYKVMGLRKHLPDETEFPADRYMRNVTRPEFVWETGALEAVPGSGFAVEYLRRSRKPGNAYAPPAAVIAAHPGNWKQAMQAYSDWAHRVWQWRPFPSRLSDKFMLGISGWPDNPLVAAGKYRDDFLQPHMDAVELTSWWDWSETGPDGVPFEQLSPKIRQEVEPYIVDDPVTGKKMFMGCGSDYSGYNERFGGLAALRNAIAANKRPGRLVTLYSNPFRLGEKNNETALHFGDRWNFVAPDGKKTRYGETINPCYYLPEVQDWMVETLARVMRDTDADGLRLDEVGHPYGACFSLEHDHVAYSEYGQPEWNKALAETVRRLRQKMDEYDPDQILMVEHQGYDYLLANLDGTLTYDLSLMDTWGTPQPESVRNGLEVNLQRFYFPECKVFEINLYGRDANHRKKFWNGVGSFHHVLPPDFRTILQQNADVYTSRDCEPLIPGKAPRIYINRFAANGKTFYHLYNASGKDFSGAAVEIPLDAAHHTDLTGLLRETNHVFDLLRNREVALENGVLPLILAADEVACIGVFPALLELEYADDRIMVTVPEEYREGRVAFCDAAGATIREAPVSAGTVTATAEAATVKLLSRDGLLQDIRALK